MPGLEGAVGNGRIACDLGVMGPLGMVVRLRIEGRHACIAHRRGGGHFRRAFLRQPHKTGDKRSRYSIFRKFLLS